jgi:methyl-accepting chemotaxis protein
MNLETKLNFSTASLTAVMMVAAGAAHWRLEGIQRQAFVVDGLRQPLVLRLQALEAEVAESVIDVQAGVLAGQDDAARADAQRAAMTVRAQAERDLATVKTLAAGLNLVVDAGRLEEIGAKLEDLRAAEQATEGISSHEAADREVAEKVLPLEREIGAAAAVAISSQHGQVEREQEALVLGDRELSLWLWVATALGAVFGLALSMTMARRVTRAIHLVADRAAAIASGDLRGAGLEIESNDQIGALARGMQAMQSGLAAIIGTVVDTAGSLTGSAASMRSASDEIHRRIDQQSQQTQQAATAMQEMSASIAEVSRHTQSAAETARSAAQTARDGGLIVKQMLGSMQTIAEAVTETGATVGLLGEDSRRISQIVTVIEEIARKTNLLALNAAIEAARAGEQGRGFAVVAGEVRRLAESTAQATGEIAAMIQGIQERTRKAIASMEAGTGTVKEGVVTTTQAGEALERIIGMAERVDRMIAQIAIAASQQAAAADQSSASLDSIYSLSHENLTGMATTAAGIESLRGTAVMLERQVDRFQVA